MKVLVIHDRKPVADELVAIARGELDRHGVVEFAPDVVTARDHLRQTHYDLVVVDLTLPLKEGLGDTSLTNVEYLLAEIFEGPDTKAPADVLGISQEAGVLELVRTNVGEHLMACLQEDIGGNWKEAFKAKFSYLRKVRDSRQIVANTSHDVDLLIVTALDKEAAPYEAIFELRDSAELHGAREFSFSSVDGKMRKGVLYAIGQAGQAPCGSATQALLTQYRPRLAIMTGFCGGVAERVNFGDVVAFKSVAAWDYGKWETGDDGETRFLPRPQALNIEELGIREILRSMEAKFSPDPSTVVKVTELSSRKIVGWKLRAKNAGSGSAVVTSIDKVGEITGRDEDIWAIDMESYAFYYACRNTPVLKPDFVCLKSVADHCNGEKDSSLHAACSLISASLAHQIVTNFYEF